MTIAKTRMQRIDYSMETAKRKWGNMENRLITVIVPAYNVEQYLEQCLDSLLYQTVGGYQVIVINDGSTDRTGEIAKRYAQEHGDVFIYMHHENRGLGATRNVGMRQVKTPYVTFLDSDDWVPPRYIETILNTIHSQKEMPDVIYTLPQIYNMATGGFEPWHDEDLMKKVFPSAETVTNAKKDVRLYNLEPSTNRKVYSFEFLKKIGFAFAEGIKWEDIEPHYHSTHEAERCVSCMQTGFFYRINSGSQITASQGRDRLQTLGIFHRLIVDQADNWTLDEQICLVQGTYKFTSWGLNCCGNAVRPEYATQLHRLVCQIPRRAFAAYRQKCNPSGEERFYFFVAHSALFYRLMKEEHYYLAAKKVAHKLAHLLK